ncbi:MAG TPA: YetF domain-containing protein [Puia sp.]|nr:YetF domain-containing protein [Puia sp.]
MDFIHTFFGEGKDLNSLQMCCRAIVSFFITLVFIRIAGIRTFGKKTAFDNVIVIMLGSIFSRVVVGASPFVPTTLACLAFVLVHRLLAWISLYSDAVGWLVKGEASSLYADGRRNEKNMRAARISEKDLRESVRQKINEDSFEHVKEVIQERNGEVSVVRK